MPTTPQTLDQALPDGTTVHIRPLRSDDGPRLLAMWDRTSERSRRLRFHGAFQLTERNIGQFVDYDPSAQYALVATAGLGDEEEVLAVARWVRDEQRPNEAEFAILVQDDQQGRGLGTALVRHLAVTAADAGIDTLSGDVLAENTAMLRVIRQLGLTHDDRTDHAVVRSDLGLDLGEEFLAVGDKADARAARAAIGRFLEPRSVALVGASRSATTVGGLLIKHLQSARFTGRLHLVNPSGARIGFRTTVPSLTDLASVPDLVVVAVPAESVLEVVDEAGHLGCKAVCVISAGFADAGVVGAARQEELLALAHSHGLRLVGPNCMGLVNTDPGIALNASLAASMPTSGPHAVAAQAGALGMAMLQQAAHRNLGVSSFVSLGNGGDISANDLLQYWELDDRTSAVLMHLESFGDPRRFARIARRVSRSRPLVAVKSASSASGARASTVTNARSQSGDSELEALFAQTGMIRTGSVPELFDVAQLLHLVDRVGDARVGIVANAGGPGVVAADACEQHGLEVPTLTSDTMQRLRAALPGHDHVGNPLDLVVGSNADEFQAALVGLADSGEVDLLLAVHAPLQTDADASAAAIIAAHDQVVDRVPVIAVTMGDAAVRDLLEDADVPTYWFPDAATRALGRVCRYARWRERPLGRPVTFEGIDKTAAQRVVDEAAATVQPVVHPAGTSVWLTWQQSARLLEAYGVAQPRAILASGRDDAARAQRTLDAPVAVKLLDPVLRKTTTGGAELGRRSPRAAAAAVNSLRERFPDETAGPDQRYLVQEMQDGVEMVVGVRHHPSFGPILVTGAGGPNMELIRDLTSRITPLTDRDADEMVESLRMRPLLEGWRGGAGGDVDALKDLLARVSAMVEDLPEIVELDCNPVFVQPDRAVVADVRVRIQVLPNPSDDPLPTRVDDAEGAATDTTADTDAAADGTATDATANTDTAGDAEPDTAADTGASGA